MQKIAITSLILISLASCTMPWTQIDTSFSGLYTSHIHSTLTSIHESYEGLTRHESSEGTLAVGLSVPDLLSGSLTSGYSARIDGQGSELILNKLTLLYTSLAGSGSLSASQLGVLTHAGESYLSYRDLVSPDMIDEATRAILNKYAGKWLSLTRPSVGSPDEILGYNIGKNLMSKSIVDIEKYATTYPIMREIADLGMSGSLHVWSVELDRAHMISLARDLYSDISGTGMTASGVIDLQRTIDTMSWSGRLAFDPSDARSVLLDGELSVSGSVIAQIRLSRTVDTTDIRITNPSNQTTLVVSYQHTDTHAGDRYSVDAQILIGDREQAKLTGYIDLDGHTLRDLSLELTAQGMTASIRHQITGDTFSGSLQAAVAGSLSWSGTTQGSKVTSLSMDGSSLFGQISVDLTQSGGMLRGPIVISSGKERIVDATLALGSTDTTTSLILDIIAGGTPAHLTIDTTTTIHSSRVDPITTPTDTRSFQDLMSDISSLSTGGFTEQPEFTETDILDTVSLDTPPAQ